MKLLNLEGMIDSMIKTKGEEATLFLLEQLDIEGFTDDNKALVSLRIKELKERK